MGITRRIKCRKILINAVNPREHFKAILSEGVSRLVKRKLLAHRCIEQSSLAALSLSRIADDKSIVVLFARSTEIPAGIPQSLPLSRVIRKSKGNSPVRYIQFRGWTFLCVYQRHRSTAEEEKSFDL